MNQVKWSIVATVAVLRATSLDAQRVGLPPIRPIGPIIARAKDSIGTITQLFQLSDGRVVVNDSRRKRLFILDSTLTNPIVIADTSTSTKRAYGRTGGAAMRYRADTILFVDATSQAFLVIDPAGTIVRVMAFPRPADASAFGRTGPTVYPIDARGRVAYQATHNGPWGDATTQDSDVVIRAAIDTRAVDTAGFIRFDRRPEFTPGFDTAGRATTVPTAAPFAQRDSWAELSDGTVAFVRAQNFAIDWLDPDGTRRTTPRVAHDWHRLSDSDRVAIVDSLRIYYRAHPWAESGPQSPTGQNTIAYVVPLLPDPASLPDYFPAFTGAAIGDADGNLWLQDALPSVVPLDPGSPTRSPVYNVINRLGVLIDRVQLPGGTSIIGFGPGVAYLQSRDGTTTGLIRVRIH